MRALRITEQVVASMIGHAYACRPHESCGLLAGRNGRADTAYLLRNAEEETPETRYLIDASDQFRAMRDAESRGLDLVGAFHSHVFSEAYPSETDVALAQYDWVWVIISLRDIPVIRAFEIGESITEVGIQTELG